MPFRTTRGGAATTAPLLLALAGALALGPKPLSAQQWIPIRSGLPWASGANGGNGGMADLQALRGRKLDLRTVFARVDHWPGMIASAPGVRNHMSDGAAIAVAFGMMPNTHRGQHAACARGEFDARMRAFGTSLIANGAARAVLRVGWEANRLNGYAWNVTGDGSDYRRCFRRWVSVLRSLPGERFVIDWNMLEKSAYPADRIYPGNDVVDIIGANIYDRCVPVRTEAQWAKYMDARHKDGRNPRGPASWLRFAKARGKKLSVPEWGIGGPRRVKLCAEPGFDNPFFMRKMFEFFRANAGSIAYEAYFNGNGGGTVQQGTHKLAPARFNPRASEVYRRLWGR